MTPRDEYCRHGGNPECWLCWTTHLSTPQEREFGCPPYVTQSPEFSARRNAQARALAANMRHTAYGRMIDAMDPLVAWRNVFMPDRHLTMRGWALHTRRVFQHDPSHR